MVQWKAKGLPAHLSWAGTVLKRRAKLDVFYPLRLVPCALHLSLIINHKNRSP
jgi:hypothetical protein